MLRWFSGLPSQKWVCPSTTNISLPSGVLNIVVPSAAHDGTFRRAAPSAGRRWASSDVLEDLVHIAEQDDLIVIDADHPPVMGRRIDLEDFRSHFAAEIFADLVHSEN